jgi:hypothetical protein
VRLCLQIHTGSVIATPESLLLSADEMGVERELAINLLQTMSGLILDRWRDLVVPHMSANATDQLMTAFRLSGEVQRFDFSAVPLAPKRRRY